jgi:acetoin utilization deacetylase AcuC-like enzyme
MMTAVKRCACGCVVLGQCRASTESAARHADDIRDIVHGEREEMARQLQAEREEARTAWEALEQQVLAGCRQAEDERDARMRELEEELARVRAELDHERQQRDHDEEMRREADSQRNLERDEETRQQLSEITDLLLAHREEFARKRETVDERWRDKLEWREETDRQFQGLFSMVQGVIDGCAEAKAKCEEERRAAEQRPCACGRIVLGLGGPHDAMMTAAKCYACGQDNASSLIVRPLD